jgi:5-aminolevulinate synthase
MESLLRQSRSMCPFLKRTSPATLRSLSTTAAHNASPGGGTMSNLQVLARRCPVMGKALAVQSARSGNAALAGAYGGVRAYHARVDRKFHNSATKDARAVDVNVVRQEPGEVNLQFSSNLILTLWQPSRPIRSPLLSSAWSCR